MSEAAALKPKVEEAGTRQVALEVVVDGERVERSLRAAGRRIARRTKIPGFRPGKAPHHVILRTVGEEAVLQEAIDELGPQIYQEAVQEQGLQPFDRGQLQVISTDPLTFRMTVPLEPEVKLPDYRSWRIPAPEVEITEEAFARAVEEVREAFAEQHPVEREARFEDLVTLDIRAEVEGQAVVDLENASLILREGSAAVVPGFSEAVVGVRAGQSRSFTLTLPEDYEDEPLRGQEASFQVRIHGVKERRLPALDEELARSAGVESLEELRDRIRGNLEARTRLEAEGRLAEEVLDRLAAEAELSYPPIALDREINDLLVEEALRLHQRGFTLEAFLEAAGLSEEEFRRQLAERARERLERSLVLSEIVRQEEIRVEEAELQEEVERLAARHGPRAEEARQMFRSEGALRSIIARLYGRKALEKVVAVVTGREEELERERIRRQIAVPHQEGEQRTGSGLILPGGGSQRGPSGDLVLPGR